jgi:metal-dependent hydrolase (beta-lactamase superfamily II)
MFKLEALQALHGDCLLLQWGTDDAPHLMLIDGGPNTVYRDTLRPRLVELIEERGEPLIIDLMMLSHIDDDHINGLLDFAKELDDNRTNDLHGRDPLRIKDDPLVERATASVTASIDAALQLPADESDADSDAHFHGKVLASVPQGQELHRYAVQLGWRMNTPFDEPALVMRGVRDEPVTIGGLAMDVVAPAATEVEALRIAVQPVEHRRARELRRTPHAADRRCARRSRTRGPRGERPARRRRTHSRRPA